MKYRYKRSRRPRVRQRQLEHEFKIDTVYRPLRKNKSFFYDPLWSLEHRLPILFLEQECRFYNYSFTGYQCPDSHEIFDDVIDGEITVQTRKFCRRISYNEFVYKHQYATCDDIADQFLYGILQPVFDEIAQIRIQRKKAASIDYAEVMRQLDIKEHEGFAELFQSGGEYYFWPIYDLLETAICAIPSVKKIDTHLGIFLDFQVCLEDGMQHEFTPHSFASVNNCMQLLRDLAL